MIRDDNRRSQSVDPHRGSRRFAEMPAKEPAARARAEVALLADSPPFVDTPVHWQEWRDTWAMQLPDGCAECDGGDRSEGVD